MFLYLNILLFYKDIVRSSHEFKKIEIFLKILGRELTVQELEKLLRSCIEDIRVFDAIDVAELLNRELTQKETNDLLDRAIEKRDVHAIKRMMNKLGHHLGANQLSKIRDLFIQNKIFA